MNPDRESRFLRPDFRPGKSGSRIPFSQTGFPTREIRIANPVFSDRILEVRNPDRRKRFLRPVFRGRESGSRIPFSQTGFPTREIRIVETVFPDRIPS